MIDNQIARDIYAALTGLKDGPVNKDLGLHFEGLIINSAIHYGQVLISKGSIDVVNPEIERRLVSLSRR